MTAARSSSAPNWAAESPSSPSRCSGETTSGCTYVAMVMPAASRGGARTGVAARLVEARLGGARAGAGKQRALAGDDAEVARLRVGDDLAGVVARLQHATDQLVEAELLGPGYLPHAVHRRAGGDAADAARHVF